MVLALGRVSKVDKSVDTALLSFTILLDGSRRGTSDVEARQTGTSCPASRASEAYPLLISSPLLCSCLCALRPFPRTPFVISSSCFCPVSLGNLIQSHDLNIIFMLITPRIIPCLDQWFLEWEPQAGRISTWEPVRNASSQAPPTSS